MTSPEKGRLDAALYDPEQGLVRPGLGIQAALQPVVGALHGPLAVGMVVGIGTLVEGHDDVRSEVLLDLDRPLRGEVMGGAVDV